jgi:transposase-like protein
MAAPHVIDPGRFLSGQLEQASPDLMRFMLTTFINALMSAEVAAICGAEYGVRSEARTNSRNGYPHRDFGTHTDSVDVAIPKVRRACISRTGCWSAAAGPP